MKRCFICKEPATRIARSYTLADSWWIYMPTIVKNIGIFLDIYNPVKTKIVHMEYACKDCYMACEHGLEAFHCKRCDRTTYIEMKDYYLSNRIIWCAYCKKRQ